MSEVFHQLADLAQRFVLRGANHWGEQSIFNRDGDAKIDIGILNDGIAIE